MVSREALVRLPDALSFEAGATLPCAATGGIGVDCVVEVGGPATVNESLYAVRWGGEVVLIGFLTTDNPGIDYFHLKASGATVRSIGAGDRAALEDLVRAVSGAGIKPVIDRVFPFDEARQAFDRLRAASPYRQDRRPGERPRRLSVHHCGARRNSSGVTWPSPFRSSCSNCERTPAANSWKST